MSSILNATGYTITSSNVNSSIILRDGSGNFSSNRATFVGLNINNGSNANIGTGAVLVGGTVTVNTTAVQTGDIIFLSCTSAGGTQGIVRISAIVNATSFTITSSLIADTSTYAWMIVRPI